MAGVTLEISAGPLTDVDFAPASVPREIAQNVRAILATMTGSVPLDRDFGVKADFLDRPGPRAQAAFVAEVVRAVEAYEPRVKVTSLTWVEPEDKTEAMDGRLTARVRVEVREGVDIG